MLNTFTNVLSKVKYVVTGSMQVSDRPKLCSLLTRLCNIMSERTGSTGSM